MPARPECAAAQLASAFCHGIIGGQGAFRGTFNGQNSKKIRLSFTLWLILSGAMGSSVKLVDLAGDGGSWFAEINDQWSVVPLLSF
jgi:hypothetical protein